MTPYELSLQVQDQAAKSWLCWFMRRQPTAPEALTVARIARRAVVRVDGVSDENGDALLSAEQVANAARNLASYHRPVGFPPWLFGILLNIAIRILIDSYFAVGTANATRSQRMLPAVALAAALLSGCDALPAPQASTVAEELNRARVCCLFIGRPNEIAQDIDVPEPSVRAAAAEPEGTFMATYAQALASGRRVAVMIGATWCAPCKTLRESIVEDEAVSSYLLKNWETVYVDAEQPFGRHGNAAAAFLGRDKEFPVLPYLVLIDENAVVTWDGPSPTKPERLQKLLEANE